MNNQALELYIKTKKDWDKRSSVRTSNETYDLNFNELDSSDKSNWHISTYAGILQHENLKSLNDDQKKFVLGTQLLEFVSKTTIMEVDYVNKVANNIALGKYNFDIPNLLKLDALKIYTDEGYHAHFSQKMYDQIKEYYNIEDDLNIYTKDFFNKVDKIGSSHEKKYDHLSQLALVIVSELIIVQDMTDEMKGIVYEPIREMFKNHILDETYHANYFKTVFQIIWPQLSEKEKEIMGLNLLESIIILGEPRVSIYYYSLSRLGFTNDFISRCIKEIYETEEWKVNKIKKRMSQIFKLLDSCGVFKIPSVDKEFKNKGFI